MIVKNNCFIGAVRFGDSGYGELSPGKHVGPARWEWFDLLCVHRGSVDLCIDDKDPITLRRGEGLLILPKTPFTGVAGKRGARISVQHFELLGSDEDQTYLPEPLATLSGRCHGADRIRFLGVPGLETDIDRAIAFAFAPNSPRLIDLRIAQLVLIMGQIQHQRDTLSATSSDPREIELHRRITASPRIQDITPAMMAGWVNLSPSRFRVWFKSRFGIPPKRYLMSRRVNRAMRLLRETQQPLKSIANEMGYADLPAFYHDFQRFTRTTPARYRSKHTVSG